MILSKFRLMLHDGTKIFIADLLKENTGKYPTSLQYSPVGGGSINQTYKLSTGNGVAWFVKINDNSKFPGLFEKEKNGLVYLASQNLVSIPRVIAHGTNHDHQVLVLEWTETGLKNDSFWRKFGEQLAKLHLVTAAEFGFEEDNYMGALPQYNKRTRNWVEFFINQRLMPQVKIADEERLITVATIKEFESLYRQLDSIFSENKPALLHGDLWSGNYMCNDRSEPVLIDPAVYFGNRNMDMAMTTLFGGFDKLFYEAYHYHYPLPANYKEQWDICNLYPLLIHLNLFGTGYLSGIRSILKKYQ